MDCAVALGMKWLGMKWSGAVLLAFCGGCGMDVVPGEGLDEKSRTHAYGFLQFERGGTVGPSTALDEPMGVQLSLQQEGNRDWIHTVQTDALEVVLPAHGAVRFDAAPLAGDHQLAFVVELYYPADDQDPAGWFPTKDVTFCQENNASGCAFTSATVQRRPGDSALVYGQGIGRDGSRDVWSVRARNAEKIRITPFVRRLDGSGAPGAFVASISFQRADLCGHHREAACNLRCDEGPQCTGSCFQASGIETSSGICQYEPVPLTPLRDMTVTTQTTLNVDGRQLSAQCALTIDSTPSTTDGVASLRADLQCLSAELVGGQLSHELQLLADGRVRFEDGSDSHLSLHGTRLTFWLQHSVALLQFEGFVP